MGCKKRLGSERRKYHVHICSHFEIFGCDLHSDGRTADFISLPHYMQFRMGGHSSCNSLTSVMLYNQEGYICFEVFSITSLLPTVSLDNKSASLPPSIV